MKKDELAQILAEKFDLSKRQAVEILNTITEAITQALKNNDVVIWTGLGRFRVKTRKARTAINPRTGERIEVPEKRVPHFSASKELKEAVK